MKRDEPGFSGALPAPKVSKTTPLSGRSSVCAKNARKKAGEIPGKMRRMAEVTQKCKGRLPGSAVGRDTGGEGADPLTDVGTHT